ncbi:hypothetical protein HGRIS_003447 [Hohenbuehelia grisea]|uniref:Uridine kinase n=1 Tax=Hohenbuehelia grisea TaxID=104357 RepID=A0ABR3JGE8_9AGAR
MLNSCDDRESVMDDDLLSTQAGTSQTAASPQLRPNNDLSIQPKKNTILVSHGRPPWYSEDGTRISDAFVVAVAGGSASGKTHVARQIVRSLGSIPTVIILSQDSFYRRKSPEEVELAHKNLVDFDHPDAIDMPLFASCLADLKAGKQTNIPVYSFAEHQRLDETKYLYGASVIITEGILALHDPALRQLYDLKVFVQCDSDLMLARRIQRDTKERGRSVDGILDQYLRYVKPAYDNFVRPSASHADIIVPGSNNHVAIDLICTHIRRQLAERSNRFRQKMAIPHQYLSPGDVTPPDVENLDLIVLPQSRQLKGIFTILRSKSSSRQDFIFFMDRLSTLLTEYALQQLPHRPKTVMTLTEVESHGQELDAEYVCGISILRSGGALERGFRRVMNNIPVGSLLVQSDGKTGEPLLFQVMLPVGIRERHTAEKAWVFLLDAQIGTGAAAFMAIRVLLDHGVRQDHIVFITCLVARSGGVSVLRRAFPAVRIVCGEVDDHMREGWLEGFKAEGNPEGDGRMVWVMQPGMGQIGDRYYL